MTRIRKYNNLLLEDDGGWDGGGYGGGGDWGGSVGGDLFKTFVQPFKDVLDTTVASAKSVTSSAQMLGSAAIRMVMTALIPGLAEDFKSIIDADKKRQANIMNQYKDVFDRNNKALWTIDEYYDGGGIIAVLFPHYVITYQLAKAAQQTSAPIITSTATAGLGLLDSLTVGASSRLTDTIRSKFGLEETWIRNKLQLLDEADELDQDSTRKLANIMQNIGNNNEIMNSLKKSSKVKNMQKAGLIAVQQTVNDLSKTALKHLQQLDKIKSIDDIKKIAGGKLEIGDEIDEDEIKAVLNDILPKARQMIADSFMKTVNEYKNGLLKTASKIVPDDELKQIIKIIEASSGYKKLQSLSSQ